MTTSTLEATPEMKKNPVDDTFYVIDFDRTLVDSDKLLEVFIEVANEFFDIPKEQIKKADEEVKERGDSFDTASYVRDHLRERMLKDSGGELDGEMVWEELQKHFIHECRSLNMLLPGAAELLEWMEENNKRYGILTYGNELWQGIKLTASGFNHVSHIVMQQKEKGKFISHWQQENGTYKIPEEYGGGCAAKIVTIDDKAVSFANYPEAPSEGYLVHDADNVLKSQRGNVPGNVRFFPNLLLVLEDLDSKAS